MQHTKAAPRTLSAVLFLALLFLFIPQNAQANMLTGIEKTTHAFKLIPQKPIGSGESIEGNTGNTTNTGTPIEIPDFLGNGLGGILQPNQSTSILIPSDNQTDTSTSTTDEAPDTTGDTQDLLDDSTERQAADSLSDTGPDTSGISGPFKWLLEKFLTIVTAPLAGLLQGMGLMWAYSSSIDFKSDGAQRVIDVIHNSTFWIAGVLFIMSLCFTGARMAWRSTRENLSELGRGLITAAVSTTCWFTGVGAITIGSSKIAAWIALYADNKNIARSIGYLATASGPGFILVFIIVGLMILIFALIMLFLVSVRDGILIILAAMGPVAGSFASTKTGWEWFQKIIAWIIGWSLYKPVAALIWVAASKFSVWEGYEGKNLIDAPVYIVRPIAMLGLCVFALPAIMKLVVPATAAVTGGERSPGSLAAGATAGVLGAVASVGMLALGAATGGAGLAAGAGAGGGAAAGGASSSGGAKGAGAGGGSGSAGKAMQSASGSSSSSGSGSGDTNNATDTATSMAQGATGESSSAGSNSSNNSSSSGSAAGGASSSGGGSGGGASVPTASGISQSGHKANDTATNAAESATGESSSAGSSSSSGGFTAKGAGA